MTWLTRIRQISILIALLSFSVFIIVFVTVCIHSRQFETPQEIEQRSSGSRVGTPSIALIGDSWIAGEKLDAHIVKALKGYGWEIELASFGHSGARSKRIYQNLFLESGSLSSKEVLFGDKPFDFVVILAGVNDSVGYFGANFYVHHMGLIVDAIIKRGSIPVIIELPEYGIEQTDFYNPVRCLRSWLFRHLFNDGVVDVILEYRRVLSHYLEEEIRTESYLFVDFNTVSTDYTKTPSIYKGDLIHLNESGNIVLSNAISHQIHGWLTSHWR